MLDQEYPNAPLLAFSPVESSLPNKVTPRGAMGEGLKIFWGGTIQSTVHCKQGKL